MAELTTIARPYSEAAFELARVENALPVWSEMLRLSARVAGDPEMSAALDNPKLNDAQKESLFLSICGEALSPNGRNFMRVLLEAGRIKLLPQVSNLFDQLKDDAEGVAHAEIVSAQAITDDQVAGLKEALERRFKRRIETTVTVDPELIGGARIVVGDEVIDASVRGRLDAMAARLKA
jgi:F-type H+-transporting ATPase subunit delta